MSLSIGDTAPDFTLQNANANVGASEVSLNDVKTENGFVIIFECNHCPFVVASFSRLNDLAERAKKDGFGFVGINSNDPEVYADDSFENMVKRANGGMPYAYLHDSTQEVATAYGAKRTPEAYLFNGQGELVYSGRIDDSPRDPTKVTEHSLADAIDAMLAGQTPAIQQTESIGCSVKWKQ